MLSRTLYSSPQSKGIRSPYSLPHQIKVSRSSISLAPCARILKILHFSIDAQLMGSSGIEVTLTPFHLFPLFLIFSSNTNWNTWISVTITVTVLFCYLCLVLWPVSVVSQFCFSSDTCVYISGVPTIFYPPIKSHTNLSTNWFIFFPTFFS